ncbi:hypothetical protein PGB90_007323 [Kerria lacca]
MIIAKLRIIDVIRVFRLGSKYSFISYREFISKNDFLLFHPKYQKQYLCSFASTTVQSNDFIKKTVDTRKSELLNFFKELSANKDFENASLNSYCQIYCTEISNLSNDELIQLTFYIKNVHNKEEYMISLVNAIDKEMCNRSAELSVEEFMRFFTAFSNICRKCTTYNFPYYVVKKRLPKIFQYEKAVIADFFNLMSKCNLWHIYHVPKFKLEFYLDKNLLVLDSEDIVTILTAMIGTKLIINTPNLLENLNQRFMSFLPNLNSHQLVKILQFLFLQDKTLLKSDSRFVVEVTRFLRNKANCDFSVDCYYWTASLCTKMLVYDQEFMEIFASKFLSDLPNIPIRHLENMIYCFTFFDFHSKSFDFYAKLIDYLQSELFQNVLLEHPKIFVSIIDFLCRVGVFPFNLIDIILSQEFLQTTFGKKLKTKLKYSRKVNGKLFLRVDRAVAIECADYKGNRLDEELRINLTNFITNISKTTSKDEEYSKPQKKFTSDVSCVLFELFGGAEYVHECFLLPHLPKKDLLFAINDEWKPQKLPLSVTQSVTIERNMLNDNWKWFTFVIMFRCQLHEDPMLLKVDVARSRQLKKIGYEVIPLVLDDWYSINDKEKQLSFLREKIFNISK